MKIKLTQQFERDIKKLVKKHYDLNKLETVVTLLVEQDTETLYRKYKDHALKGNWKGFRECHIEADWLLIYRIHNDVCELVLVRTGNHDNLLR